MPGYSGTPLAKKLGSKDRHKVHVLGEPENNPVSWPKQAAKMPADITENAIRDVALPLGFDDVKVCAVDETWSGLAPVVRRELL